MDEDSSSPRESNADDEGRYAVDVDGDERPSEVIVRAVSAVTNCPPLEMTPLHDAVDPDALDALFRTGCTGPESGEFTFAFNGCEVTLRSGTVYVRELDER